MTVSSLVAIVVSFQMAETNGLSFVFINRRRLAGWLPQAAPPQVAGGLRPRSLSSSPLTSSANSSSEPPIRVPLMKICARSFAPTLPPWPAGEPDPPQYRAPSIARPFPEERLRSAAERAPPVVYSNTSVVILHLRQLHADRCHGVDLHPHVQRWRLHLGRHRSRC